jgi:Mannosylglycerate hydrolase MGH1-like glycoside hydrolase domain
MAPTGAERQRLAEDADRLRNWKRWGPYLSERQWGTVREDYSATGDCWNYLPHDHARSRAYRWGEDGLLGFSDREGRLCVALALWNGRDPILKERLFGLSGPEGNHGEDVKECYFFLDSTPTHSYCRALYKYPQSEFPYARLVAENRQRGLAAAEFELADTGVFDESRYFDVTAEYAKGSPNDLLIRLTVANRGPAPATLHLLPSLWFRNTWSWGRSGEGYPDERPRITRDGALAMAAQHPTLGRFRLVAEAAGDAAPIQLFTENETNRARLFGAPNPTPYVKDAFHDYVIGGRQAAVNPAGAGTKAAFLYRLTLPAGAAVTVRLRLADLAETPDAAIDAAFDARFAERRAEAEEFYEDVLPTGASAEERNVIRQCDAGLLWSKQFYYYIVEQWLQGDPAQPPPPPEHREGRNRDWGHVYNRDVISMPDTWEYPWYAAWDLAFHMIPFARLDPQFAKDQLVLLLREWYMHPNGQIPAYEFAFGDVNPPVHAWACWRVYKMTGPRGKRDRAFLERTFQKLLLNFTWWVNRKDPEGRNLFAGGFLGLDNIGAFDRSKPLPTGGHLEQADGTAWMAFFCATMLSMAFELAGEDPVYEDLASKFFEHFIAIADAMNSLGGTGLWDEQDGFYYDQLRVDGHAIPLRVRSLVGLLPLIASEILEEAVLERLPSFRKRMDWFITNRPELMQAICCMQPRGHDGQTHRMLAIPSRERLTRVLRYMLDEREFLSPHGLRSVSQFHRDHPYVFRLDGVDARVEYVPGDSNTRLFGGNSNWRGPVWFPLNYLLIEALERYHHFYGEGFRIEYPTGSGRPLPLGVIAQDLAVRLATTFLPDQRGYRPCHGDDPRYATDPHWRGLVLFHEFFHGDTSRGLGASHQTGWTSLVVRFLEEMARARSHRGAYGSHLPTMPPSMPPSAP